MPADAFISLLYLVWAEIINTATAATALWKQQPLAADAYAADWQQVADAEARALKQYPDAREVIRAQVRVCLCQMRDGVARSGAYGPVERKAAVEFLNQLDSQYRGAAASVPSSSPPPRKPSPASRPNWLRRSRPRKRPRSLSARRT